MSIVYRAYDPKLQRILAIKLLKPEFSSDDERYKMFLTEGHISGKLNHPGIVSVFDVGEYDGQPFIVMEYLESSNLDDWLSVNKGISLEKALEIILQIVKALEYAHGKGVIHRDIKPSNILIDAAEKVKLTDFGVAYQCEIDDCQGEQAIAGTPFYMAPEQLMGAKPDEKSDLYSCGVLLYQMVFESLPYEASSIHELVELISRSDMTFDNSRCPPSIVRVIRKLLHKSPKLRYHNASQLVLQIEGLKHQTRLSSNRWIGTKKFSWKYTIITASVVLSLVVASFFATWYQLNERQTEMVQVFGEMLTHQVREKVDEPLVLEDFAALGVIVTNLANRPEVKSISVLDHDSVVKASSRNIGLGSIYKLPFGIESVISGNDFRAFRSSSEDSLYIFDTKIEYGGKSVGRAVLGVSLKSITDIWNQLSILIFVFVTFWCIAIPIVLYRFSFYFEGQFEKLADALRSLVQGNYYTRLHVENADKIGYARKQLNELAEQLESLTDHSDQNLSIEQIPNTKLSPTEPNTVVILKRNMEVK